MFPFTGGGGGSLNKNFFSQSEHVSSQIGCQKFFPLLGGGGVPSTKIFFPVWTCIKPNLVPKIFPFTGGGGGVLDKNFFSPVWTCMKPNLVSKNFPFTRGGPSTKIFFLVWTCIKPNLVSKIFSLYWDWVPPRPETRYPPHLDLDLGPPLPTWTWDSPGPETGYPPDLRLGTPLPHLDLDLGPPPTWTCTLDPPHLDLGPPLGVDWQTENSTFPHPSDAGGNNFYTPIAVIFVVLFCGLMPCNAQFSMIWYWQVKYGLTFFTFHTNNNGILTKSNCANNTHSY